MTRWGLRVIVTLAALLVPAYAFARGGHGHGGHCGHSRFGRPAIGHNAHAKPLPPVGRPFPWLPAPFVVRGGQFMQCAGQTIAAGESPQGVRRACGEPTLTRQSVRAGPTGTQTIEVWSYARPNGITRNLRFENGKVSSIDTVHEVRR